MQSILNWLDSRTGFGQAIRTVLYHRIPGGPRWRYVWGTALLFAIVVQFITGVFLWMHYSPSTQTAWESVFYIEHMMVGGSMLRGIHHYTSSAVMILMAIHLLQVIIYGAYRAPREVTYWLGLAMMLIVFGLGQTGYLLPWDQRGFRATQVATTIAGVTPVVGDQAKAVALGGDDFGHHTLTRFFALHAGVLPGILVLLVVLHVAVARRHGYTTPEEPEDTSKPDGLYWPDQAMRDGVACLAVIGTVWAIAAAMPAELGPPSDATVEFNTARPEWYFRFLFQLLKYFQGATGMFVASQLIPGLLLGVMALMPFIGKWQLGRRFNVLFVFAVLAGIVSLSAISFYEDYNGKTEKSKHHMADLALASAEAHRAHELASMGIPALGAREQTRTDPMIAGRRLFKRHCASCHSHHDADLEDPHQGLPLQTVIANDPSAPNLFGFGSRRWMEGILDAEKIAGPNFFGHTQFAEGEMVDWVNTTIRDELAELPEAEKTAYKMKVKAAAWAISAQAELPYQREADQRDAAQIEKGMDVVLNELSCIDCHSLGEEEVGGGPDLTGYGSDAWLTAFISNPQSERFYYSEDNYDEADRLMPGFAAHPDDPKLNKLPADDLSLIVRWIRRDWPTPEADAETSSEPNAITSDDAEEE